MAWKYFYRPDGMITYFSDEVHFETAADDEFIVSDVYYDPNVYDIDPVAKQFVEKAVPRVRVNPQR